MADTGSFRSSLHGFNRQDVLDYIDTLQNEAVQAKEQLSIELDKQTARALEMETESSALSETVERLQEENTRLETLTQTQAQENAALREKAERVAALTEELGRTKAALKLLQQDGDVRAKLKAAHAHGKQLSDYVDALEQDNERLRAALQSVRDRIQSVHTHGQNFVSESLRCSDDCLTELEDTISSLEEKLGDTRRRIGEERVSVARQSDVTGIRLHELISTLRVDDASTSLAPSEEVSSARRYFDESASQETAHPSAPKSASVSEKDTIHIRRVVPSADGKFKKWMDGWFPREK